MLAGSWYDGNPDSLASSLDQWLQEAPPMPDGSYPLALIAPHAGHRYSGKVAAAAYATLRGRSFARVFLLGPSHRRPFQGLALADFSAFQTPLGSIPVDREELAALAASPLCFRDRDAHQAEHSLEIHLPFLQRALKDQPWQLVPIMVGQLDQAQLTQAAALLATRIGPGDLVVASSDFTHYGRNYGYGGPRGQEFGPAEAPQRLQALMDEAFDRIRNLDHQGFGRQLETSGDTICGHKPIQLLLALLPREARAWRLASDTSGALTGDFSSSVSYMSVMFSGLWPYNGAGGTLRLEEPQKQLLLKVARGTLEAWVRDRKKPSFEDLGVQPDARLLEPQGVFVTLKIHGDLRGCIGTIPPVKPLAEAVRDNAINAASHDPRFPEVTPEELASIEVEVSVLGLPTPVDSPRDIVLARDGVLLNKAGRGAVFLPQVAPEQGWTLEMTLSALARKAGLPRDAWQSGAQLQVFQALVFHEE
jgi:AmmeMemoRadiSam system protein B/AmmeMemoRadiSam system protein A